MKLKINLSIVGLIGLFSLLQSNVSGLTISQVNQNPRQAYVLSDSSGQPSSTSGVRISLLDLQFETADTLKNKYMLPDALISKLQPFLGLKGEQAANALKKNPIDISPSEYETINTNAKKYWSSRLSEVPPVVQRNPRVT